MWLSILLVQGYHFFLFSSFPHILFFIYPAFLWMNRVITLTFLSLLLAYHLLPLFSFPGLLYLLEKCIFNLSGYLQIIYNLLYNMETLLQCICIYLLPLLLFLYFLLHYYNIYNTLLLLLYIITYLLYYLLVILLYIITILLYIYILYNILLLFTLSMWLMFKFFNQEKIIFSHLFTFSITLSIFIYSSFHQLSFFLQCEECLQYFLCAHLLAI